VSPGYHGIRNGEVRPVDSLCDPSSVLSLSLSLSVLLPRAAPVSVALFHYNTAFSGNSMEVESRATHPPT